ncbi:MAG: endonuclease dU [Candidatus Bathyarchaeaceae archaeon]
MSLNVWREFRVVGVEDGGFSKEAQDSGAQKTLFVCILFMGKWVSDFQADMITIDGLDATEKLVSMLRRWSFDAVMLAGVSFAGFNLVDPTVVFEKFNKPIIIISRTKPNNIAVKNALRQHFEDWQIRWGVFEKLGPVWKVVSMPNEPPVYVEVIGAELDWASKLIRAASLCCRVPEPIRVARLVARGLTRRVL